MRHRTSASSTARRSTIAALGAGIAAASFGIPAGAQVAWRTAPDARAEAAPVPAAAAQSLVELAERPALRRVVVELDGVAGAADREALGAAGVTLLGYVGANTYFATIDADRLDAGLAVGAAGVVAARAIRPEWKMHPLIAADDIPAYAVVGGAEAPGEAGVQMVAVYALFHDDVPLEEAEAVAALHAGVVRDRLESINGLVLEVPRQGLPGFADDDAVQWVEVALPQMTTMNAENRVVTQVNEVEAIDGLTGAGVRVMVFDGGTMLANHQAFSNGFGSRVSVRDNDGLSDHATHVGGTIGGSGAGSSGGAHRGMAPGVFIDSFGFQFGGAGIFLYSNPGDIEADYNAAINTYNNDISNNSIGTNTASNGFPCEITGDYGVTSNLIDTIVRGGLGRPFRVVWANGNERGSSNCGNLYYTTAPPATAKNHCTVGALNANDDSMTGFSSWGPTDDGRMKPDVAAPGCQSNGDDGVTSCSSSGGYNVKCGTSMASPTVCGIGALLIEAYRDKFPLRPDFRNSMLRALLAHTAADLGNAGPDYQFGYGSVRAKAAVDQLNTGSLTEGAVSDAQSVVIPLTVEPGQERVKVTLAWDDAPGEPNVEIALVNQLDLVVTDPDGVRWFPWTLDPSKPGAPATQDAENTLDNIEQVFVEGPIAGEWLVEVRGTSVPVGPQPFSVVATPDLTAMILTTINPPAGLVEPGEPIDVDVVLDVTGQELVEGSASLFFRFDGASEFSSVPLAQVEGALYTAAIPGPLCEDVVEYFVGAEGSLTGPLTDPPAGGAEPFTADVGVVLVSVEDDMEADAGWTVGAPGDDAGTGVWNRMDPQGTTAQPEDDRTPGDGTDCWVTDGFAGSGNGAGDVDGGKTTLISPVIDAAGVDDPVLSYWRWYSNSAGATPNTDVFVIDISNDAGDTWINLETIGPDGPGTSGGWIQAVFDLGDVIEPTSEMRLRFIASDEGEGSLVEAAIDDLVIDSIACDFTPPVECDGDLNGDLVVNSLDLNALLAVFGTDLEKGDLNGDGAVNSIDLNIMLANFGATCG